jgi:hypothetical protein
MSSVVPRDRLQVSTRGVAEPPLRFWRASLKGGMDHKKAAVGWKSWIRLTRRNLLRASSGCWFKGGTDGVRTAAVVSKWWIRSMGRNIFSAAGGNSRERDGWCKKGGGCMRIVDRIGGPEPRGEDRRGNNRPVGVLNQFCTPAGSRTDFLFNWVAERAVMWDVWSIGRTREQTHFPLLCPEFLPLLLAFVRSFVA